MVRERGFWEGELYGFGGGWLGFGLGGGCEGVSEGCSGVSSGVVKYGRKNIGGKIFWGACVRA